jgi:hypothetical protein
MYRHTQSNSSKLSLSTQKAVHRPRMARYDETKSSPEKSRPEMLAWFELREDMNCTNNTEIAMHARAGRMTFESSWCSGK